MATVWEEIKNLYQKLPVSDSTFDARFLRSDMSVLLSSHDFVLWMESNNYAEFLEINEAVNKEEEIERFHLIEQTSQQYFKENLQNQQLLWKEALFFTKFAGSQLGRLMTIAYQDELQTFKKLFFVKTHIYGGRRVPSNDGMLPDLRELLVYKTLEIAGFGPKVHFMQTRKGNEPNIYIASQDMAFSKCNKRKLFEEFEVLEESLDADDEDAAFNLVFIEVLSQILLLEGVYADNFGRVTITEPDNSVKLKWVILDFSLYPLGNYRRWSVWDKFLKPTLYEPGIRKLVVDNEDRKIPLARKAMEILRQGRLSSGGQRKLRLLQAVEEANSQVIALWKMYCIEHSISLEDEEWHLKRLEMYVNEDIPVNWKQFEEGLKSYGQQKQKESKQVASSRNFLTWGVVLVGAASIATLWFLRRART